MQFPVVSHAKKTRTTQEIWCRTEADGALRKVNELLSALFMRRPVTYFPKQQGLRSVESGDTAKLVTQLH